MSVKVAASQFKSIKEKKDLNINKALHIAQQASKENVNISSVDIKAIDSIAEANIIVQVKNNRQLNRLMRKITKLKNIDYVERVGR